MPESKTWNPSHWTDETLARHVRNVRHYMREQLGYFLGEYRGAIVACELFAAEQSERSRRLLEDAGHKTMGAA